MARLESQALAGFYKTADEILPLILRHFAPVTEFGTYTVIDPCAGEGEAAAAFTLHCFGKPAAAGVTVRLHMMEMEQERAGRCEYAKRNAVTDSYRSHALQGDGLAASFTGDGASALWLNPPYDVARGERFELRFQRHWQRALAPGGQLVLIVPEYTLEVLRTELTQHFDDIAVLRYPEPLYSVYKQVVVLATKRTLRGETAALPAVLPLDAAPQQLRMLPPGSLDIKAQLLDVAALIAKTQPLPQLCRAAAPSKVGLAMRPKPAHVAMALGSGIFNGVRLSAPGRDDLLAKAVFHRTYIDTDQKLNEKGELVKLTQVERPELRLTTLNLRTGDYAELSPGVEPSNSGEIRNFADLLLVYGDSMVAAMRERCPSLHDVGDVALTLPPLKRPLYPAQMQAAIAALKLIDRGQAPLILGELGSGKSACSLQVLLSLTAEHTKSTQQQLDRCARTLPHPEAFPDRKRLRPVHKALVVCPPHLVQNWRDEIQKCLPFAEVSELVTVSDVDRVAASKAPLAIALLSRETAKLGSAIEGVTGRCSKCGARLEHSPEKLASSRAYCAATMRQQRDRLAAAAMTLRGLVNRGVELNSDRLATWRRSAAVALLRHYWQHTTRLKEQWQSKRGYLDYETERKIAAALGLCGIARLSRWAKAAPTSFVLKRDDAALGNVLAELGRWKNSVCGEPLWQRVPKPRRFPLSDYIAKRHRGLFQLLIADEAHEYSTDGSAQERALHRLVDVIPMTLPLTGSLMNGYAKSLFRNLWALSPRMRQEFGYSDAGKFAKLYGYQKRVLTGDAAKQAKASEFGSASDRVVKTEGGERIAEAPGVLPSFVLRHILPISVTLHKRDINPDDRVVDHDRQEIVVDETSLRMGQALGGALKRAVTKDRFDSLLAGKLFGQLAEYPSYFDRATLDTGNTAEGDYVAAYPQDVGGYEVYRCAGQLATVRLGKEAWFIETLRRELAEGRNVLVFLWHKELAARLRLLCADAGVDDAVVLDANKVPARKRQDWIDKYVVSQRKRVLITNPTCVQTGLNNLIHFSTAIFFENPGCSPFVARQAVGRLDRITQTKEVRIYWPVYTGVQCALLDLLQNKTAISQQIDGIDPTAALEMAGGGEATAQSLDVGMAVYKYLGGE